MGIWLEVGGGVLVCDSIYRDQRLRLKVGVVILTAADLCLLRTEGRILLSD